MANRLKIAVQKSGRLNEQSITLLQRCGLNVRITKNALIARVKNLPIDILLVRDDDIPTLVMNGICDLGIVGENVLFEKYPEISTSKPLMKLGFGRCRLSIATPNTQTKITAQDLDQYRIASSYPNLLQRYLTQENISANILNISGSVEIAPQLGMADAICDLVSSGRTLEENNLVEQITILNSEAVLIKSPNNFTEEKNKLIDLLTTRMASVIKARASKYILFHAPKSQLPAIKSMLPGCEAPTVVPLTGIDDKVAIHLVSPEEIFWETLENLKILGASSILVLPIEKMMN